MRQPGASRAPSSRRAISWRSSSSSSSRRTRSRSSAASSSIRLAWPRTISTGRRAWSWVQAARPDGDQLGRGGVDRLLALADLGAQPRLGLGQRQAGQPRVDEIADLVERAGADALRPELDHAILDAAVGADQHRQRARRASGTKLSCLSRSSLLRREHHAGAGRQARQRRRGRRQRILDRLVALDLALDSRPLARRPAPRPA